MKPIPSSEHDEQYQEMIELLKDLGSFQSAYPSDLLNARRAAFLKQVDQLGAAPVDEEFSAEEQEIVNLLGRLKSVEVEYPPDLLAARRVALLRQIERAETISLWEHFHLSLQRVFQSKPAGFMQISLVVGSLLVALLVGSLLFSRIEGSVQPPSPQAVASTHLLPTSTGEVAITICKPKDETSSCLPEELASRQDLADTRNGAARPAVSKDARVSQDERYEAAYVNDGRGGDSWVSNSTDSWIKIDLGQVTTINTVSLQKGSLYSSTDNNPGQFVIAVALSDVYADGDSNNDYMEYAQVFHSEQTGFSGAVSQAETIQTHFPTVQARFVKITFKEAGAAIEEIGIFMVEPPVLAEQPTRTPRMGDSTPVGTNTLLAIATQSVTSAATGTGSPIDTAVVLLTNTPPPAASNTPTTLPTYTLPPPDTSTPVPTEPLPSDTPIPLPTIAPPTAVPPTSVPPTAAKPPPPSTDPIVVTGNHHNLTFTCNGNAADIRGHSNTVTLLGSCSSITVTGNGNRVFWESGSPVITNKGKDNIIQQL